MSVFVPKKGRPRSDKAHRAILVATLSQISKTGFRALSVDAIAAQAGVGKTTIYRRWPNKAAVVMDAFLDLISPGTEFPADKNALKRIQMQLRLQAKFFRGKYGKLIKAIVGEAQFDPELAEAFHDRWIIPRRQMVRDVLEQAVKQKLLRANLDFEATIDLFYGPFYYRLMIETAPISDKFADEVYSSLIRGLTP